MVCSLFGPFTQLYGQSEAKDTDKAFMKYKQKTEVSYRFQNPDDHKNLLIYEPAKLQNYEEYESVLNRTDAEGNMTFEKMNISSTQAKPWMKTTPGFILDKNGYSLKNEKGIEIYKVNHDDNTKLLFDDAAASFLEKLTGEYIKTDSNTLIEEVKDLEDPYKVFSEQLLSVTEEKGIITMSLADKDIIFDLDQHNVTVKVYSSNTKMELLYEESIFYSKNTQGFQYERLNIRKEPIKLSSGVCVQKMTKTSIADYIIGGTSVKIPTKDGEQIGQRSLRVKPLGNAALLFPNPAGDFIRFNLEGLNQIKVNWIGIYSINGKLVKGVEYKNGSSDNIAIHDLPIGMYIVKFFGEEGQLSQKFIKR